MSNKHFAKQNLLFAALPMEVQDRLERHLEPLEVPLGRVLHDPGDVLRHVYFPTNSLVSLLYVTEDGDSAELAVVGREGMVGVPVFLNNGSAPSTTSRALVQCAGFGFRLPAARLREEFNRHSELLFLLLRYAQALFTQTAQTAVCNRHHTIDQHLCRRLLLSLDRLPGNEVSMTQELIANMLGVRREGVTAAARKLHEFGVIEYRRGRITVLDRAKLEQRCCECYAVVQQETKRLLPYFTGEGVNGHAHAGHQCAGQPRQPRYRGA